MTGVSKAYLVAYNAVQFLGWSYLLVQTLTHLAGGGAVHRLTVVQPLLQLMDPPLSMWNFKLNVAESHQLLSTYLLSTKILSERTTFPSMA